MEGQLPFHNRPLKVLVEAKLIAFPNTPFGLTDIRFNQPRHASRPRAFQLLGGNLQGFRRPLSFGVARCRVLASSLSCRRVCNAAFSLFGRPPIPRSLHAPNRERYISCSQQQDPC